MYIPLVSIILKWNECYLIPPGVVSALSPMNALLGITILPLSFHPSHLEADGIYHFFWGLWPGLGSPVTSAGPQRCLKHCTDHLGLRRFDLAQNAMASQRRNPHWSFQTSQCWTNLVNDAGYEEPFKWWFDFHLFSEMDSAKATKEKKTQYHWLSGQQNTNGYFHIWLWRNV